jgi:hypothetical protein
MFTKTFNETGTFQALYAAKAWLAANGYSCGTTCRDMPCGILKGDFVIAKWKNLTKKESEQLDGRLEGDMREGPITITLKEAPPDSTAIAALEPSSHLRMAVISASGIVSPQEGL